MSYGWLIVSAAIAVIDWVAVAKNWKWLEYFAKPGTMIALLLWVGSSGGLAGPLLPFTLGAFFSLIGDIALMLPGNTFIAGLIAFLLAHVCYIVGFNTSSPPLSFVSLVLAVLVGITAGRLYQRLAMALVQKGERKMRLPVLIYASTITLMLLSALLTIVRPDWKAFPALLASTGAALFFTSDSLLAWDRFVAPLSHRGLKVMVTYHLGQFALLAGAVLNFHG
jgi:uncharacterized membrane protein YhhN